MKNQRSSIQKKVWHVLNEELKSNTETRMKMNGKLQKSLIGPARLPENIKIVGILEIMIPVMLKRLILG